MRESPEYPTYEDVCRLDPIIFHFAQRDPPPDGPRFSIFEEMLSLEFTFSQFLAHGALLSSVHSGPSQRTAERRVPWGPRMRVRGPPIEGPLNPYVEVPYPPYGVSGTAKNI